MFDVDVNFTFQLVEPRFRLNQPKKNGERKPLGKISGGPVAEMPDTSTEEEIESQNPRRGHHRCCREDAQYPRLPAAE